MEPNNNELATISFDLKTGWIAGEFASFLTNISSFYALSLNLMAGKVPSNNWTNSMEFPPPWNSVPDGFPQLTILRIHINSPGSLDVAGFGKAMEQIRLLVTSIGGVVDKYIFGKKERYLHLKKLELDNDKAQFEALRAQEIHKLDVEERTLQLEEKKLELERKRSLQKLEIQTELKKLRNEITSALNEGRMQKEAHAAMMESLPFLAQRVIGDKTLLPNVHPVSLPHGPGSFSPGPGQGPSVAQFLQVPLNMKSFFLLQWLAYGDIAVSESQNANPDNNASSD